MKKWFVQKQVVKGKATYYIRRYLLGSNRENLKSNHIDLELYQLYVQFREESNFEELRSFCNDLNSDQIHREVCRKVWLSKIRKAPTADVFDQFFNYLKTQHSEKHAKDIYGAFNNYSKKFFYENSKLHSLYDWKSYNTKFCDYLWEPHSHKVRGAELNVKLSLKRIKTIISTTNYFYQFLRDHLKDERYNFKFTNSKSIFMKKNHEVERIKSLPKDIAIRSQREWINDNDLQAIYMNCPEEIASPIKLAIKFGLRESETLGLTVENVLVSFLHSHQQLSKYTDKVPTYGPLKNRKTKDVPYYLSSPEEAYQLIENMKLMSPRTLGKKWNEYLEKLVSKGKISKKYEFHSLRNTFITNLVRKMDKKELDITITDVQLAAGHSNRAQTEAYLKDYRNHDGRQKFIPSKKVA